jgi:hypothetical protein
MPQPAWVKGRLGTEPFISRLFYGLVVKRSSTYMMFTMVTATVVGAWLAAPKEGRAQQSATDARCSARTGIGYDYAMDGIWNKLNKGVRAASPATHSLPSCDAVSAAARWDATAWPAPPPCL